MSKILAIKGDEERGNEVVALLEMLGGCSSIETYGLCENRCYSIKDNGWVVWGYIGPEEIDKYEIFTLDEFYKKYPFKVGDKVVYTKYGDNCDDYPVTIESMKWTGTTIEYTFDDCVTCLAKDLKMWSGEPDAVISGIYLNSCDYADEVELYLGDYEIEVCDGRTFAVKKKPKYPKTYEECCKILGCKADHFFTDFSYKGCDVEISDYEDKINDLLRNFRKLRYCRDAYWKIAGEEMGLGKPWESTTETVYGISRTANLICQTHRYGNSKILEFPTKEMRDVFYENFEDLIEQCKELL